MITPGALLRHSRVVGPKWVTTRTVVALEPHSPTTWTVCPVGILETWVVPAEELSPAPDYTRQELFDSWDRNYLDTPECWMQTCWKGPIQPEGWAIWLWVCRVRWIENPVPRWWYPGGRSEEEVDRVRVEMGRRWYAG